jgi:hypothetical protein
MPARHAPTSPFPVRGVPGGWRDLWDEPNDHAELRAKAEATERRQDARAKRLGAVWQQEICDKRRLLGAGGAGLPESVSSDTPGRTVSVSGSHCRS